MKKIIKIIFIAVFIATIIFGGWILLNQPNDDILYNKMDWVITIFMLAPVLITEFEIYSICTYGFTKEKNKTITILKILSLAIALLFLGFFTLSFYTTTNIIYDITCCFFGICIIKAIAVGISKKD